MSQKLDLKRLLPNTLKNETLSSLVSNLFNRFVSEEQSLLVSGRVGKKESNEEAFIKASNLERELNSLIPALYLKTGTEETILTFSDLVNKLETLGVDTDRMKEWMAEQNFNFTPPINADKFVNFTNYYWAGGEAAEDVKNRASWNPSLSPEYIVIERPKLSSSKKFPVRLATDVNIARHSANRIIFPDAIEKFTITFTSPTQFNVVGSAGSLLYSGPFSILTPEQQFIISSTEMPLVSFYLTNGSTPFSAGDIFEIDVKYFTSEIYASFIPADSIYHNKGVIDRIVSLAEYMNIDGYQLQRNDRILVMGQSNEEENGIYEASGIDGTWTRASDAEMDTYLPDGTLVYVNSGLTHSGKIFKLVKNIGAGIQSNGFYKMTWVEESSAATNFINEWQEFNYWFHKDDVENLYGISTEKLLQAKRPILEFANDVQLNEYVDAGNPNDAGTNIIQKKTRFNQLPQFDLFYYDGTHAGVTSSIFFYAEDQDFPIDEELIKRAKTTENADFIFETAIQDSKGRLLFFKRNNELTTVWTPGPSSPAHGNITFDGGSDRGNLTISAISNDADNQKWRVVAVSATEFKLIGERHGEVTTPGNLIQLGVPFVSDDFTLEVSAGINAFVADEQFSFFIRNKVSPRYVQQLADGTLINYAGGLPDIPPPEQDRLDNGVQSGVWLTPIRMFQNLKREFISQINFADLIEHFRRIIKNQDNFEGISFGVNNFRNLDNADMGFGGSIREFDSNFPLLLSMLAQKDLTPLSILDFGENQYNSALASIDQFILSDFVEYITNNVAPIITTISPLDPSIQQMIEDLQALRAIDENLKTTFFDTTSGIKNWPVTLSQIGVFPKTVPTVQFDDELGLDVIVHHDGHETPLAFENQEFNAELVRLKVKRSDGQLVSGIFNNAIPAPPSHTPYARQLWLQNSTRNLYVFDVVADTSILQAPAGSAGQYWFDRDANILYEWDSIGVSWIVSSDSVASRWKPISVSSIRNSLVLALEQILYDNVHPAQELRINLSTIIANPAFSAYQQVELAKFAAKYNFDVFGTDFSATDAFTWNYKQAVISGVPPQTARWFNIYKAYFDQPGISVSTSRPNIEPWKLLNYANKPVWWDSTYASTVTAQPALAVQSARVVATSSLSLLSGLQTIDGITVSTGDRILLVAQADPIFNGLWIAGPGSWSRASDVLVNGTNIYVTEGHTGKRTTWVIITPDPIILNVSIIQFQQQRFWLSQMWADIKTANPSLKLCVNIYNDELLSPYVSSTDAATSEALLNVIPSGTANIYEFNDDGPTEMVWKRSLEYIYGLARSYFKKSPMEFLDKTWGETYLQANDKNNLSTPQGIRIERNVANVLPHSKFQYHGELLHNVNNLSIEEAQKRIILTNLSWTGAAVVRFEVSHVENNATFFSVFVNDAEIQSITTETSPYNLAAAGLAVEGYNFSFSYDGIIFEGKIDDMGIPFSMGDSFIINFFDDVVDPLYVPPVVDEFSMGCEGCVSEDGAPPPPLVPMVKMAPSYEFIASRVKTIVGLGQLFTNMLRYSFVDTDYSYVTNAYRAWDVKLVHRFGAMVRSDNLTVKSRLGYMPPTAFNFALKRSSNINSKWISGLRVQLVEMGEKKLNQFGYYVPRTDGADWVFRVEVYNALNPTIDYYELDTSAEFQTFYALQKESTDLAWKKYTSVASFNKQSPMPKIIIGVQNVINVIFGYTRRLEELGFSINMTENPTVDAETGRNLDWQLEVEKFVDRVYSGLSAGEGHILNPFYSALWLSTPSGIMSKYSDSVNDVYVSQTAYDVVGKAIPIDEMSIIRNDESSSTYSLIPIFSAHLFTDEYEHALVFNNTISSEKNAAAIFIPFLGISIDSIYLTYFRNKTINFKPTFNGFFITGNTMKRNIVSSVDQISNYYDATRAFDEPEAARHALALLGYSKRDYFNNIDVTDATQFNFWRGLIQAKGTNMTVNAFVNYRKFNDAAVDEYWAYKLADYGDSRSRTFPELKIETRDVTQRFSQLQFYASATTDKLPLYTIIEDADESRWFSIDDLGKGLRFSAKRIEEIVIADQAGYYRLNTIFHNGDNAGPTISPAGAEIKGANLIYVSVPGTYTIQGYTWDNPTKFSPVKLFDYESNVKIKDIPLWHPAIGHHTPEALDNIDIIAKYDPAQYNYSLQTVNNPNYHLLHPWAQKEVSRVWWDTSELSYIPYYDSIIFPDRQERQERWGTLAEWSRIKLYEWVESSVPPQEYDAKALVESGRSDIPVSARASGKAARKQFYKRNRSVKIRPIAWSNAGIGSANAYESFGPAEFIKIWNGGNALFPDTGTTEDINLTEGRHFGGWMAGDKTTFTMPRPIGEVVLTDQIVYDVGRLNGLGSPVIDLATTQFSAFISIIDDTVFGARLGQIKIESVVTIADTTIRIVGQDNTTSSEIVIFDWAGAPGAVANYDFESFGLRLTLVKNVSPTLSSPMIANELAAATQDIFIREGVRFTTILPIEPYEFFINDGSTIDREWRAWNVPQQSNLDNDLLPPNNAWYPYPGEWIELTTIDQELIANMDDETSQLTTKYGEIINRYESFWTEWIPLIGKKIEKISNGVSKVEFLKSEFLDAGEDLNLNRLQIFANGIQLSPNLSYGYQIKFNIVEDEESVELVNIAPEGTTLLLVYLPYVPTEEELSFNPDDSDDFNVLVQYKKDYQYTKVDVRNEFGLITESKYYFWVEDKTTAPYSKSKSISTSKALLESGPSMFMLLSRILPNENAYDSCAIAGMNRHVTKNNTYKLRFELNNTLRDDPEEINLKNIHSEWTLLRKWQLSKIPIQLWNLITDAAAGEDIGGNPLPSQVRYDYDMRNGTNYRFGFGPGQIFAETELVRASIMNAILNTQVTIKIGKIKIPNYISSLDFNDSDNWFRDAESTRITMSKIWNSARAQQINEIFFAVLEDALANNYEFSDIFKTSFITVSSSSSTEEQLEEEIADAIF